MSNAAAAQLPVTVLLVEDERLIIDLVADTLRDAGFTIVEATSGDAALAILDAAAPDVPIMAVVTDVDLGTRVSGWDVAKRARELRADTPIVYMTGGSADDWSANGVPNSILVNKPFVPMQIVTAISQLLNSVANPLDPIS